MITETQMSEIIQEAIYNAAMENDDDIDISTFRDVGMMTNNEGFVIRSFDGSEFQVTIVQSR